MALENFRLLATLILYLSGSTITSTVAERSADITDKIKFLEKLKDGDQTDSLVILLQAFIRDDKEFENMAAEKKPLPLAAEILNSLKKNASNPFHKMVNKDTIYGGGRKDLKLLSDMFGQLGERLKNFAKLKTNAEMEKTDAEKLTVTVAKIQGKIREFLNAHETSNPYWDKYLEQFLHQVNKKALSTTEKAKMIQSFLLNIMTKDQFVVIATQLHLCYSGRILYNDKFRDCFVTGKHTLMVMRSGNNVTEPYRWEKMEPEGSKMMQLFNCTAGSDEIFHETAWSMNATMGAA